MKLNRVLNHDNDDENDDNYVSANEYEKTNPKVGCKHYLFH